MRYKKILGSIAALALAVSTFAGFAVTANAADVYSNDCSTTTNWAGNTIDANADGTVSVYGAGTGNRSSLFSFPTEVTSLKSGKVNVKFDFQFENNKGVKERSSAQVALVGSGVKANGNALLTTDVIAGIVSTAWTSGTNDLYYVTGKPETTYTVSAGQWYTFDATLNYSTKTVSFSISELNKESALITAENVSFEQEGLGGIYILSSRLGGAKTDPTRKTNIDNIAVSTVEDTGTTANYTVNYVYTNEAGVETTVKTQQLEGEKGNPVPAPDTSAFKDEKGQKYFCVSSDEEGKTVADNGSTVVTVTLRKAEVYNLKVVSALDEATAMYEADVDEGESYTYSFSKYLTDENNKVIAVCNDSLFTKTIAPTANKVDVIPYVEYTGVAYAIEAENAGLSVGPVIDGRLSGGKSVRMSNDGTTFFTVPKDGIYKITTVTICRNTANSSKSYIYKNEVSADNLLKETDAQGHSQNNVMVDSVTASLATNDKIILSGNAGETLLDYAIIEEVETPAVMATTNAVVVGATAVAAPADTTMLTPAEGGKEVAYSTIAKEGDVVTTIYIKVANPQSGVRPVVTLKGITDKLQSTKTEAANGLFIYQYVGEKAVEVESVTY